MHYQGVVFSDAMEMRAIAANYGLEEAIKLAVNAGIDILCFAHNAPIMEERTGDGVHALIRKFVTSGEISKARIDESFRRIMKLKNNLGKTQMERLKQENQMLMQLVGQRNTELKKAN